MYQYFYTKTDLVALVRPGPQGYRPSVPLSRTAWVRPTICNAVMVEPIGGHCFTRHTTAWSWTILSFYRYDIVQTPSIIIWFTWYHVAQWIRDAESSERGRYSNRFCLSPQILADVFRRQLMRDEIRNVSYVFIPYRIIIVIIIIIIIQQYNISVLSPFGALSLRVIADDNRDNNYIITTATMRFSDRLPRPRCSIFVHINIIIIYYCNRHERLNYCHERSARTHKHVIAQTSPGALLRWRDDDDDVSGEGV